MIKDYSMKLHLATLNDVPAIWEILQQAIEQRRLDGSDQWQNGYPNPETVVDDIKSGYGYVLENDSFFVSGFLTKTPRISVIAYAAIIFGVEPAYNDIQGKWLTHGEYVVIHRVATSNTVKGKGVATKLFQMIEELSRERKVYSIKVDTNFDNVPMLKIMDRLGYTYCGEVFFHGAPRKAFEKVLTASK